MDEARVHGRNGPRPTTNRPDGPTCTVCTSNRAVLGSLDGVLAAAFPTTCACRSQGPISSHTFLAKKNHPKGDVPA